MRDVSPSSVVCEECVALGAVWVGLRMCAVCGKTGCCDNSSNHHARGHFDSTGHPIIHSSGDVVDWSWCYVEKTLL